MENEKKTPFNEDISTGDNKEYLNEKHKAYLIMMVTIFLGGFGFYRFYKKQYLLGAIYLATLGLLCFGWLFDVFLSFKEYFVLKNQL